MLEGVKKEFCYGCSACATVCPKNSIEMIPDEEGFKYPVVDNVKCVGCGLCEKACPVLKPKGNVSSTVQKAYGVKHNNENVLRTSASGGFFTAISDVILAEGGVIYGAAFDDDMVVRHFRATTALERDRMKGSKYVQSDIGDTYLLIKKDLQDGKKVLFTGTPCQTDGLRRALQGRTDNRICVDLICHGTPSPLVFADHIKMIEAKTHKRVINYCFRPKKWSWHVHREIAYLSNGKEYHSNAYSDLWRTIYYMKLATKLSCHHCQYSCLNRPGDLTMGDCRGIDAVCPGFGSNKGVSLVLVNTPTGVEYFEKVRSAMKVIEISIDDVMQPPLREPSKQSGNRMKFMSVYRNKGYMSAVHACLGRLYYLKYNVKKLLNKN